MLRVIQRVLRGRGCVRRYVVLARTTLYLVMLCVCSMPGPAGARWQMGDMAYGEMRGGWWGG